MEDDVCCVKVDPGKWDKKTHEWKNKLFIRDYVVQLFHIPLNMGPVVTRMMKKIDAADASPKKEDFIMLAYDPSPWKSEIYMTVTHDVPNAEMTTLSGTFLSRVYDGPYQDVPKWMKEQEAYVHREGKEIMKHYFFFTTCPKCIKKYGHNYVVAFTQVK